MPFRATPHQEKKFDIIYPAIKGVNSTIKVPKMVKVRAGGGRGGLHPGGRALGARASTVKLAVHQSIRGLNVWMVPWG